MRFTLPLSLLGLALILTFTFTLAGAANARVAMRPDQPARVGAMRVLVGHYRDLTWTYERAARVKRTPSSLRDRRTNDVRYLQRSIDIWTRRAYRAERRALAAIHTRLLVPLPHAPTLHARLFARVSYSRRLALSLRRIYPGHVTRPVRAGPGTDGARDAASLAAPQRLCSARRRRARAGHPGGAP